MKYVLKESGGKNNHVIFIFTEDQIREEYFLQDIDVLLNSGEVPNIFSIEEIQDILEVMFKFLNIFFNLAFLMCLK